MELNMTKIDPKNFNTRHGGPFDRGMADYYYSRGRCPNYFVGATYDSVQLEEVDMSEKEIADYNAGYTYGQQTSYLKSYD